MNKYFVTEKEILSTEYPQLFVKWHHSPLLLDGYIQIFNIILFIMSHLFSQIGRRYWNGCRFHQPFAF